MPKRAIDRIDVASKRVLMRVDFNVPLDDTGVITDDRRIRLALPGIRSVIERGGRLILMSHLGRPKGVGFETQFSLKPAADRLSSLLEGVTVRFPGTDCLDDDAQLAIDAMNDGEIIVLENLRFHPGEKKGDEAFAARLASYADIYCNEAFGTAHREHASMVAVPHAMADRPRVAGCLLEKELKYLGQTLADPARPFAAVLGGAKVSDKLGVLFNLMGTVDTILIGGAMAYPLLKSKGHGVGSSRVETDMLDDARKIIKAAAASDTDLVLPRDHVCGRELTAGTATEITGGPDIADGWSGFDIGPKTRENYAAILCGAKTIFWNGPMGVFEIEPFHEGTLQVAKATIQATDSGAISVVGGGDTVAAVETFDLADRFSHVSTGGGACLQMLEGRTFASVELLDEA